MCSVRGPEARFDGEVKRRELAVLWVRQVEVEPAKMGSAALSALCAELRKGRDVLLFEVVEYLWVIPNELREGLNDCKLRKYISIRQSYYN